MQPGLASRLRHENPWTPVRDGRIRGYHPQRRAPASNIALSVLSPRDFVARFGRKAYDAVPRWALLREGHRKGIAREYIEDDFPPVERTDHAA